MVVIADGVRADPMFTPAGYRLPDHADLCGRSTVARTESLPDRHALRGGPRGDTLGVRGSSIVSGDGVRVAEGATT